MIKIFLNPEGHQNPISGSKVDFAYWWSFNDGESAINGATPSSYIYISLIYFNKKCLLLVLRKICSQQKFYQLH